MKSWKNVTLQNICEKENILYARKKASKGKRERKSVIDMTDDKLSLLAESMLDGTYIKRSKSYRQIS